jgi:hypothetical protein
MHIMYIVQPLTVIESEGLWWIEAGTDGRQWKAMGRVHSHAPSIQSHRGTKVVRPDFQPMRVPEEPVCIHLFRQNPVFTSLHLKSPVHVVPPLWWTGIDCDGWKAVDSGKSGGQWLIAVANSNLERWIAADTGGMTWMEDLKCREVKTGFCRKR